METTKEAIWFQDLLSKLAILKNAQVLIYCNIESCIKISKDLVYHSRTKRFTINL
jgi:hypothetical protein